MVGRGRAPVRVPSRQRAADGTWSREPSVGEMLEDPIVNLMMARDHVGADEIRRLISAVRRGRELAGLDTASH